ncbi:hypothetical protein [Pseudarthrobacter sp. MM222]|uniref:hypothetical protein n=1 Tax=Pseudarthrobacter sp. MM222 TaxID=3018929 RepID=UPI00221F1575|nr:hypothetical protein [Pseudarthrobacter sp. MM222]CAI3793905.1 hypothetical protein NKCBBBOE_00925 [Pseudarthrobacter sp. MM222]
MTTAPELSREQRDAVMRSEPADDAYAAGEPLRAIAADLGCTVDELCNFLATQPASHHELQRARSVRRRSLATDEVLYKNRVLLYRLAGAGIAWSDTPKVLKALQTAIDVEVGVELVNIPGVASERTERALPPRTLGDKLSLLYVAGKHHGIEPDYQLALGTMPIEELAALRSLMQPSFPPRRLAEFAAVAETTKLAIRARALRAISYADYTKTAAAVSSRLGNTRVAADGQWPVPGSVLLRRYGYGFWDAALRAAGLSLPGSESRFTDNDFFDALDGFTEECMGFEHPMSIATYDRWVFSEASMRNDRPSAVEIIRHYGSWASAMQVILPEEEDEDDVLEEDTGQSALVLGLPPAVRRAIHPPQQSLGF